MIRIQDRTGSASSVDTLTSSHLYTALPATVSEEATSLESVSHQSLTTTTTTSDDSDTVRIYDFKNQATTTITKEDAKKLQDKKAALQLRLNEDAASVGGVASPSPVTPVRGATPTAFKFLQPKRRLIEPNQVLSIEEGITVPQSPMIPIERGVIEEDVAQVLPSVKALAQAFLASAHKDGSQPENKWKSKVHKAKAVKTIATNRQKKLESHVSVAEIAEDATIASDLSSLETDPPTHLENIDSTLPSDGDATTPVRSGFLKSNIAFFENLKFK